MKSKIAASVVALSFSVLFSNCALAGNDHDKPDVIPGNQEQSLHASDNTRIQVALLLDTSNSMDGLIEQAKSRLWNIVNALTTLKYNGNTPKIEIALYEYGNDGLSAKSGHIRQVLALTTDLDLISEKLFSLRTNGGSEYCGAVINKCLTQLEWGHNKADMKLIYIAGNESFDQGNVSYKEVIPDVLKHDIFVNTIFCGGYEDGISSLWQDGAKRGNGKYFNIDADKKVRFMETPYDEKIEACNRRINDTYIGYGAMGGSKKRSQAEQDANAKSLSKANYAERAVSKSKGAYKNDTWDLVDKMQADSRALDEMKEQELPEEYRNKSKKEIEVIVAQKSKERAEAQKEIAELARLRQAYIDEENKKAGNEDDLGAAISSSVLQMAKQKGYVVEE